MQNDSHSLTSRILRTHSPIYTRGMSSGYSTTAVEITVRARVEGVRNTEEVGTVQKNEGTREGSGEWVQGTEETHLRPSRSFSRVRLCSVHRHFSSRYIIQIMPEQGVYIRVLRRSRTGGGCLRLSEPSDHRIEVFVSRQGSRRGRMMRGQLPRKGVRDKMESIGGGHVLALSRL